MAEQAETEHAELLEPLEAREPLRRLLEVQERDLLMDQLTYRRRELGERKSLSELDARVQSLEVRAALLRSESEEIGKRQADIEAQVATYAARIAAIETRLREGGGYREVQAMSAETDSLDRHRRELEDKELEAMEELEPVDQELQAIEGELFVLGRERAELVEALSGVEAVIDSEMTAVGAARAELASGLPDELAATYERLRQRLGGIGAAKLVEGACSGCHLHLPTGERERLLHASPGEVVFCDQCGRILVA